VPVINIPLDVGFNNQADQEEVGTGAIQVTNIELDKPGMIYKRKGKGSPVSVAANIKYISKWIYSGTSYFVITTTDGTLYVTTSLGTLGSSVTTHTGNEVRILNYGTRLRFAPGLSDYPKVYQNIDRHFFWSTYQPAAGFVISQARPVPFGEESDGMSLYDAGPPAIRSVDDLFLTAGSTWRVSTDSAGPAIKSGLDYSSDIYYYKLTKVYDGNQESALTEEPLVNSGHTARHGKWDSGFEGTANNSTHNDKYFGFQFQITESSFDERITAFNVYRSKNSSKGPYYKLDTISTLGNGGASKAADPNVIKVTDALVLNAEQSNNSGKVYLVTSEISSLAAGDTIVRTNGSRNIGNVSTDGIGSSDGYGYVITIEPATGSYLFDGTGSGSSYAHFNNWNEPVTWNGGSNSGRLYSSVGNNMLTSSTWRLGEDDYMGAPCAIEGNDFQDANGGLCLADHADNDLFEMVQRNNPRVIAFGTGSSYLTANWLGDTETSITVLMSYSYMWQDRGATHHCWWYDRFTDGAVHPYGTSSLKTKFKYSVNLDGRQFVGNVKIEDATGVTEDHPDWVLFSELTQPDVIPISNYISIPDLQGGEIVGLAKLVGDLVIFQEKGIYRLSVPSADPTTWSLIESEPNLGCTAPDSIVEYKNGVFFAGQDAIYFLNSNFEAIPINNDWKDDYILFNYADSAKLHIDIKKSRLLFNKGVGTYPEIFAFELPSVGGRNRWTRYMSANFDGTQKAEWFWFTDEDFKTYAITGGGTSYVSEHNPTSQYETVQLQRVSGWINLGDIGDYRTIKRLNIRYKSSDVLTVKIFTDGDGTTKTWQDGSEYHSIPVDTSGSDWYTCKPGIRCKYFKIDISTATYSTNTVEIYRLEIEYE